MKIKQQPEDFVVEERTELDPCGGPFALYRLTKRHIGTLEAVAAIAREWNLRRRDVSFCGLKDRHALSTQFVTIRGGPQRVLERPHFRLEPLGFTDRPAGPAVLRENRFTITVRDLDGPQAQEFRAALLRLAAQGLPNYYDEQRFGSARSGEFAARRLIDGDAEGALRLAIATPTPEDSGRRRQIRHTLAQHWGDWATCRKQLPPSSERSIAAYLEAHPDGFRNALELMDGQYRFLLLSAFQSYLWNSALARLVRAAFPRVVERLVERWRWPFPEEVTAEETARWAQRWIPLPAHRMEPAEPEVEAALREVLAEEGLEPRRLRLRGLRRTFFARGRRAAWLVPRSLEAGAQVPDECSPGRWRVTFTCVLPKGSYATLLTRRLLGTWKRGTPRE